MDINSQTIIGDVVSGDYRTATIFANYAIDFCCNGNRTLEKGAEEAQINLESLLFALNNLDTKNGLANTNYQLWDLDFLADYIYHNHHKYVEEKIPVIKQYLDKICSVHGKEHPELLEINALFKEGAGELTQHMKKEELILFPFIKKMILAEKNGQNLETPHFGTVENPIAMMQEEHNAEGERYRKISALSNNYTLPLGACNSYRVTYGLLQEFEKDLHLHIHLESNILFKKALALEKKLNN